MQRKETCAYRNALSARGQTIYRLRLTGDGLRLFDAVVSRKAAAGLVAKSAGQSARRIGGSCAPGTQGRNERLEPGEVSGPGESLRKSFLNVYVNEEDIRFLGGNTYAFQDGDEVLLVPSIAGGSR